MPPKRDNSGPENAQQTLDSHASDGPRNDASSNAGSLQPTRHAFGPGRFIFDRAMQPSSSQQEDQLTREQRILRLQEDLAKRTQSLEQLGPVGETFEQLASLVADVVVPLAAHLTQHVEELEAEVKAGKAAMAEVKAELDIKSAKSVTILPKREIRR